MNHTTGSYKYIPLPREQEPDIYSIDYKKLKKLGFDTILYDYDFTLTVWKKKSLNLDTIELLENLNKLGFKVAIVTNAPHDRVEHVESVTNGKVKVYSKMRKPSSKKLRTVLEELNSVPEKTVMIGDLFFTDVLGGNKLGMYTIMINPYTYEIDSKLKKLVAFISRLLYFIFFYTIGWFFRIMDLAVPNEFNKSIFDIDYQKLIKSNYNTLFLDFDNTLVEWRSEKIDNRTIEFLKELKQYGFNIVIATNGRDRRFDTMKKIVEELNIDIQTLSMKPLPYKINRKIKEMNLEKGSYVLIGDQLFTDIIAGNTSGCYTIKIDPVSKNEGFHTKVLRRFEKLSIMMMRTKPKLFGGESDGEM